MIVGPTASQTHAVKNAPSAELLPTWLNREKNGIARILCE